MKAVLIKHYVFYIYFTKKSKSWSCVHSIADRANFHRTVNTSEITFSLKLEIMLIELLKTNNFTVRQLIRGTQSTSCPTHSVYFHWFYDILALQWVNTLNIPAYKLTSKQVDNTIHTFLPCFWITRHLRQCGNYCIIFIRGIAIRTVWRNLQNLKSEWQLEKPKNEELQQSSNSKLVSC